MSVWKNFPFSLSVVLIRPVAIPFLACFEIVFFFNFMYVLSVTSVQIHCIYILYMIQLITILAFCLHMHVLFFYGFFVVM